MTPSDMTSQYLQSSLFLYTSFDKSLFLSESVSGLSICCIILFLNGLKWSGRLPSEGRPPDSPSMEDVGKKLGLGKLSFCMFDPLGYSHMTNLLQKFPILNRTWRTTPFRCMDNGYCNRRNFRNKSAACEQALRVHSHIADFPLRIWSWIFAH